MVVGIISTFTNAKVNPFIVGTLAVLGLVVGYFVYEKNVQPFLLASVSLVLVSFAGIQGLVLSAAILGVNLNQLITSILGALMMLFVPATIIVAIKTVFSLSKGY